MEARVERALQRDPAPQCPALHQQRDRGTDRGGDGPVLQRPLREPAAGGAGARLSAAQRLERADHAAEMAEGPARQEQARSAVATVIYRPKARKPKHPN
jgi:hypothetical protein